MSLVFCSQDTNGHFIYNVAKRDIDLL